MHLVGFITKNIFSNFSANLCILVVAGMLRLPKCFSCTPSHAVWAGNPVRWHNKHTSCNVYDLAPLLHDRQWRTRGKV